NTIYARSEVLLRHAKPVEWEIVQATMVTMELRSIPGGSKATLSWLNACCLSGSIEEAVVNGTGSNIPGYILPIVTSKNRSLFSLANPYSEEPDARKPLVRSRKF